MIQLRAKLATDAEAIEMGQAIREHCRAAGARFVVNDRFDIALACGADAVHLGQGDVPPARVPASVRAELAIGRSTHTLEQARAAVREPVDYVAFGPVFGTTSKQSAYDRRGPEMLRAVADLVAPRVLVAIGGIGLEQLPETVDAGARGVALISAVAGADDPEAATRTLADRLAELSAGADA